MRIFKRLRALEDICAKLLMRVSELLNRIDYLEAKIKELEKNIPAYEQAVASKVDEVWNKALQDVADYDPYKSLRAGGIGDGE